MHKHNCEVGSYSLSVYFRMKCISNTLMWLHGTKIQLLFMCGRGFKSPVHAERIYSALHLVLGWTCKVRSISKVIFLLKWTIYLTVILSASPLTAKKDRAELLALHGFKASSCIAVLWANIRNVCFGKDEKFVYVVRFGAGREQYFLCMSVSSSVFCTTQTCSHFINLQLQTTVYSL